MEINSISKAVLSPLILVNNVSIDNKNRRHWYHVSLLVFCSDGTTSIRDAQINTDRPCVNIYALEGCKKSATHSVALGISANIQSVSYLGFMTEAEFFGKPTDGYAH